MGIKFDENTKTYIVFRSKRRSGGGAPATLRRKGIKSLKEAQRVHDELLLKLERKCREVQIPTVKKVIEEYLEANRGRNWTIKTFENYAFHLNSYLSEYANVEISEITSNDIDDIFSIKLKDKSESHKKSMHKYLNGLFKYAFQKGYVTLNPVLPRKFKARRKLVSVLSEEQMKTLIRRSKEVNSEWYPIWTLAVYLGLRSGELYALRKSDVEIDRKQITVKRSWNSKDGFKSTKNGYDRRVEIAESLVPLIQELLKRNPESEFLLPHPSKWTKGEQARVLRTFLIQIGLPSIRFHDLRASWATALLAKGIPPLKIAIMAGWEDLKTMQRYIRYGGVDITGVTEGFDLSTEEE